MGKFDGCCGGPRVEMDIAREKKEEKGEKIRCPRSWKEPQAL